MTLDQVATAIGTTKGHLSRLENHKTALVQPTAEAIAAVFGIDAETLRNRDPGTESLELDLLGLFRGVSEKAQKAIIESARAIATLDKGD